LRPRYAFSPLSHKGHKDHEVFYFIRVLCVLRVFYEKIKQPIVTRILFAIFFLQQMLPSREQGVLRSAAGGEGKKLLNKAEAKLFGRQVACRQASDLRKVERRTRCFSNISESLV
jgi:hypothetical protein